MTTLKNLGETLRRHRKRQKLAAAELAARSGIHRNTLSALELGVGNVELNTLLSVCDQLGLELLLVPRPGAAASSASQAAGDHAPAQVSSTAPQASRETLLMRRIAARRARAGESK